MFGGHVWGNWCGKDSDNNADPIDDLDQARNGTNTTLYGVPDGGAEEIYQAPHQTQAPSTHPPTLSSSL